MYEEIFLICQEAIKNGEHINRISRKDKEFHFQNWFLDRLTSMGISFTENGRNSYPDFIINSSSEGYEIKGLTYPGRTNDFDANSQVPKGKHKGRDIYYVFGRYPVTSAKSYPVHDLVICHGSLLNTETKYIHKNKSTRSFGSYGDILIRDRKMYVPPTPYGLLKGIEGAITLIIPDNVTLKTNKLEEVGKFTRVEEKKRLKSYSFDLDTNVLKTNLVPHPSAGIKHNFIAYRVKGVGGPQVSLK